MKGWSKVFILGIFCIIPAKLLAPIAVLFVDRKNHPIWGIDDTDDFSYWNCAIRNGAHNLLNKPAIPYETVAANTNDETLEKLEGLQWRYRRSIGDGEYVSFRVTWGKPRNKGKREFYIGWTMNETSRMGLSFFQLRLF